ncbi:cytidylyltransferase domain-containing protein, partial [Candidatus Pelagibacter sp. HIMB1623]|uniref:cytidylyltransferase domain-containing protein n=1 Tax=Candidatus Pelagibacter sp. HIMB1623 TaxID=3413358 RepID=UPI003F8588E8
MKIGFLITARLKSTRLKFKILKKLNGYTVIERIIQRAKKIKKCSDIVLCTSSLNQDLPLVKIAKDNDIFVYNGSAEDVLQRLLNASELFGMDYFIGITADNPLFSIHHANLISKMIRANKNLDYIYTSGMPIGANIYGIRTKALKTVCQVKQELDTEIWGYLINRPEIFKVKEIKVENKYRGKNFRLTLDEEDDYIFFRKLYDMFPKNQVIDLLKAYKCLEKNPELSFINSKVNQRDLDNNVKKRISIFYKKNKKKIIKL